MTRNTHRNTSRNASRNTRPIPAPVTVFTITVLALFSISCNTPENYEGEPNIYAVLSTDLKSATVMIGLTASISDTLRIDTIMDTFWYEDTFVVYPIIHFPWNGVSGAYVKLEHSSSSYETKELPKSIGYYATDSNLVFSPNDSWKLTTKYPDGKSLEARTRFPKSFNITAPSKDTVTWLDTLRWSSSDGAKGYQVSGLAWGWKYIWKDTIDSVYDTTSVKGYQLFDSSEREIPLGYIFYYDMGIDSIELHVEALDTNIYDYIYYGYNSWNQDINKEDYMHIEGAWGVFGSKTVIYSKRYVFNDSIFDSIPPIKNPLR